jgi:signal peptidase II
VKSITRKAWLAWGIVLAILLIDQCAKIYVKLHFALRESVEVTSWFHIAFIENNGMAYGMELGNKLLLTLFRIVAVGFFGYSMWRGVKQGVKTGLLICMALVVAGALGNIVDCVCYGRLFTDSYGHVAQCTLTSGLPGYAPWFRGRVVDMLYFPLIEFNWPDWVPTAGQQLSIGSFSFAWSPTLPCSDEPFRFFEPVFNIADSAICVGFAVMVLFYYKSMVDLFDDICHAIRCGRPSASADAEAGGTSAEKTAAAANKVARKEGEA